MLVNINIGQISRYQSRIILGRTMGFLLRHQCHEELDNASGQCLWRRTDNNQPITIHITPLIVEHNDWLLLDHEELHLKIILNRNLDYVCIKMWVLPSQWDPFKANWCLNISHKKLYKKTLCATGGRFSARRGEKAPCVNTTAPANRGIKVPSSFREKSGTVAFLS